jgi:hypothetical protein
VAVSLGRATEVAEQRLAERQDRPRTIITLAVLERAPRMDRSTPRMSLDEELGELTMRENAVVTGGRSEACEPCETRNYVRRIERAAQRTLDLLAQVAGLDPRFHHWRLGCSERSGTTQRIVPPPSIWVARAICNSREIAPRVGVGVDLQNE